MSELKNAIAQKEIEQQYAEDALNKINAELVELRSKTELPQSKMCWFLSNIVDKDTLLQDGFNVSVSENEQYEVKESNVIKMVYGRVARVSSPYYVTKTQAWAIEEYLKGVIEFDVFKFVVSE